MHGQTDSFLRVGVGGAFRVIGIYCLPAIFRTDRSERASEKERWPAKERELKKNTFPPLTVHRERPRPSIKM